MSRAMNQVSGAASEPMIAIGSAAAYGFVPKMAMNGASSRLASGSQWAFDGIGSTAGLGRWFPTSAKIHTKSTLSPCPAAIDRATST